MAKATELGRQVVIDAGAAIKLQRLERFGGDLFTTPGVIAEIRDENARALLKTLPQEIRVRDPLPQDIAYTKQFAKATGDLGFLSHNDLDLIALTVGLYRQSGGSLREKPAALSHESRGAEARLPSSTWAPPKAVPSAEPRHVAEAQTEELIVAMRCAILRVQENEKEEQREAEAWTAVGGSKAGDNEDALSEDGSSGGEWVTAENLHRFDMAVQRSDDAEVRVTCATADYSIQNVLLQMGITPFTFDGYAVRSVKLWGLICRACCFFTRDTQKVFCPKCGHDTVVRVPIIVGQDGQATVVNAGRKLRTKGTIYSIPKHQGGRGWKPIFAEDELRMGGRDRELRHLEKLHEKERASKDPFNEDNGARAWYQRGTTSSGRNLISGGGPRVQAGYGRKNPNANNFKHPSSKKR